jgi:hypothetical protein
LQHRSNGAAVHGEYTLAGCNPPAAAFSLQMQYARAGLTTQVGRQGCCIHLWNVRVACRLLYGLMPMLMPSLLHTHL